MATPAQTQFIQLLMQTLDRVTQTTNWSVPTETRNLQSDLTSLALQTQMSQAQSTMQMQAEILKQQQDLMRSIAQNMKT